MAKFKNDKGLTLIELLITIAVLAVVSAIALPVINNVVSASNSNALNQTIKDANDFINKYSKSGVVAYDGLTKTFSGYVDTDGDNQIDSNELIDTLTLDANKFNATANGTSPAVGGSYSNGGVTGATVTAANSGSTAPVASTIPGTKYSSGVDFSPATFYGDPGGSAFGYVSPQSPSQALMDAVSSMGTGWSMFVMIGSETVSYQATNYSNGSVYFSPDWSTISSNKSAALPNFTYSISDIWVDSVAKKVHVVLVG
jgi:prepilin-type N-terminal cleavage/methylation domain-containing protein